MKEIFKTVVEPLISLPKWCFWIQTTLICVYHINLNEDAEKVLKSPSFYPPSSIGSIGHAFLLKIRLCQVLALQLFLNSVRNCWPLSCMV